MLGESQEYFGPIAEVLAHPMDVIKAMAQETSNVYETEGLVYSGAYVIADVMIGRVVTAGISKVAGTGAGAVDDIGNIANRADDVMDVTETAGKMDDVAEIGETTGKADAIVDVPDMSKVITEGKLESIEAEVKKAAVDKFTTIKENWIDDVKADEFINTLDQYAQKSVDIGACDSVYDFYKMYFERSYTYSDEFIENIKKPYLDTGASSIINVKDIENAFGRFETIGRAEYGNFTTSVLEDSKLLYDSNGSLVNTEIIESIKGVDPGKYTTGVYQYCYDPELVNSIDSLQMIRVVDGETPGASAVNIPGGIHGQGKI